MMKNKIRKDMKAKRKALSREEMEEKSRMAARFFLESEVYKKSKVLMVYMPLGNETDTKDIIESAFRDGKQLVLPSTDSETGIITPVIFNKDATFEKGGFAVYEPINPTIAHKSMIDTVIVPGIAFGEDGSRVGFGKGCYDMFLKGMNVVRVGLCYEFQLCDSIPLDEHDIKMDFLVTEKGMVAAG